MSIDIHEIKIEEKSVVLIDESDSDLGHLTDELILASVDGEEKYLPIIKEIFRRSNKYTNRSLHNSDSEFSHIYQLHSDFKMNVDDEYKSELRFIIRYDKNISYYHIGTSISTVVSMTCMFIINNNNELPKNNFYHKNNLSSNLQYYLFDVSDPDNSLMAQLY